MVRGIGKGLGIVLATVVFWACDSDIGGVPSGNIPPETELSVRDASLVDNIAEEDRLTSSVRASWSGFDRDGFVAHFELRFWPETETRSAEEDWVTSSRNDSLILLPIPRGSDIANVIFEVRAVDDEGLKDETPARTVFPIRNAPPTIKFDTFELAPDTTFSSFSFAWVADDPEGIANLQRIEVSLNDTVNFVALPTDTEFATLVGQEDISDANQSLAEARVFLGRSFQSTTITVPGLLLDQPNTFYVRAVDFTDTTSVTVSHTWFVKKQTSDVLFVSDFRVSAGTSRIKRRFHLAILREYLPAGYEIDAWEISTPYTEIKSDQLPGSVDPALRQMLAKYRYIYWMTSNATNNPRTNNLAVLAGIMDEFFDNGGRLMVHTPIKPPADPDDNTGNAATVLLPFSDFVVFPDSLNRSLRVLGGASITPGAAPAFLPEPLPALSARSIIIGTQPYETGASSTALYDAEYQYSTRVGNRGPWFGTPTVSSVSADGSIALFALPIINNLGDPVLEGTDGDPEAPRRAVKILLEGLGFPK